MIDPEAILYYADNPVDFVEDIIRAKPDPNQRDILNSIAKYPMTSVRSGHGIGKSAVESWAVIWFLATRPIPEDTLHGPHPAPALGHSVGRNRQMAEVKPRTEQRPYLDPRKGLYEGLP